MLPVYAKHKQWMLLVGNYIHDFRVYLTRISAKEVLEEVVAHSLCKTAQKRKKFTCVLCKKNVFNLNRHLLMVHKEKEAYRISTPHVLFERRPNAKVGIACSLASTLIVFTIISVFSIVETIQEVSFVPTFGCTPESPSRQQDSCRTSEGKT